MSFVSKIIFSLKWSSVSQVGRQVMQLLTIAILARLLSPSDFGLVGMATIVIGFIGLFQDLGTSSAIIQRKELSKTLVNTIFWLNLSFGLLAMLSLFLLAPLVASFYQEPRVISVLRVLSLNFLFSSLSISQKALLEKNLAFNTLAKIEIIAVIVGSFFGIGLALMGGGVWSLVLQTLSVVITTTILLWVKTSWKPQIIFCWSDVKEIRSYSLHLTGFNILNYFCRNGDYLLIGRFLGSQDLGYYTLAYRLMLYPLQNISTVISRVMFPVFSKIQNDDARFRNAYLRVVGTIALISFPMMVSLWALADPFVVTFFGMQWEPVILLLMILAPLGMIQSIGTTVGIIYTAKGRTDWMFRWGIGAGTLILLSFVIGLQWGIVGVAGAYSLVSGVILFYPSFFIPFRLINLPMRDFFSVLWRPFVSSLLMLVVLLVANYYLTENLSSVWVLSLLVATGIVAYLLASWLINREQMKQLLNMAGAKL